MMVLCTDLKWGPRRHGDSPGGGNSGVLAAGLPVALTLVGGDANDTMSWPVVVVVRVNIGWCFNRDGIVTATAPRVTAQDTFDGQPQTF